jgi:hypothetical protein
MVHIVVCASSGDLLFSGASSLDDGRVPSLAFDDDDTTPTTVQVATHSGFFPAGQSSSPWNEDELAAEAEEGAQVSAALAARVDEV